MPLNGLRWSRNSGSANCDMPQSAVFGRPGGGVIVAGSPAKIIGYTKDLNYNISSNQKDLDGIAPYLQPKE